MNAFSKLIKNVAALKYIGNNSPGAMSEFHYVQHVIERSFVTGEFIYFCITIVLIFDNFNAYACMGLVVQPFSGVSFMIVKSFLGVLIVP
jgi:hypothetical protein